GTYCRDKDAVYAAMILSEIACYYKAQGMSMYDAIMGMYERYGYFIENTESKVYAGFDSNERREAAMAGLREKPIAEIGLKVEKIKDYLAGVPGFTKSNVLFYELTDGCAVVVRPSGTEPKIKSYVMAQGATYEEAEARRKVIREAIDALLN
ncbi:MAG: phospho-sugar mutase, partial [Mogibacterium sp.]|nr:phospho-sugar mutase [Mogibacterium sp.]